MDRCCLETGSTERFARSVNAAALAEPSSWSGSSPALAHHRRASRDGRICGPSFKSTTRKTGLSIPFRSRSSHVNLVAEPNAGGSQLDGLFAIRELGDNLQQAQALRLCLRSLDIVRIEDSSSEHSEAAADADDREVFCSQRAHVRFKARGTQERQVGDGTLCAGENHDVGVCLPP
jgi:hypothetical protein